MIVILNNGARIRITDQMAQAIFRQLLNDEARQWQCQFVNGAPDASSAFNLKQISVICKEEDIL